MKDRARKSGQVVLVLAFMLLGLLLLALVGVDAFLASHRKNRLQNAGDAAALAAARWQGITLNALGALNLAKIDVLCKIGDPSLNPAAWDAATNICERVTALQERIAFAGPLMGFYAAQRAALKNGVDKPDADMAALVAEAASRAPMLSGTDLWPEKAEDYADMLRGAARDGVCAGVDNAQFFNFAIRSSHPLYSKAFYEAVAGEDWCWFYLRDGMNDLLASFAGWSEIPFSGANSPENPEFFGTDVRTVRGALADFNRDWTEQQTRAAVLELADRNDCPNVNDFTLQQCGVITNRHLAWVAYGAGWHAWKRMHRADAARLPLISDVKEKYDVQGAFAATRVIQFLEPFTPGVSGRYNVWTAAAKPFGSIDDRTVTWNGEFPLVTPAFTDVRLVMLGAFDEGSLNMADRAWVTHTRDHVQPPSSVAHAKGCTYCNVLRKWEDPAFRAAGVKWLAENGEDQCRRPTGGGAPGGGTRHAH